MENRCFLVQFSSTSAITVFKANEVEPMLGFISKNMKGLAEDSKGIARNLIEDPTAAFGKKAVEDKSELPKVTLRSAESQYSYAAIYLGFVGDK